MSKQIERCQSSVLSVVSVFSFQLSLFGYQLSVVSSQLPVLTDSY